MQSSGAGQDGQSTQEALQKYAKFADEVLKPQLKQTLQKRDEILQEISEYEDLQTLVQELQSSQSKGNDVQPLHTLMDLGQRFHVRAKVPNPSMIIVDIGLQFHAEMTLAEATTFVHQHLQHLAKKRDEWQRKAREVSDHVNVVLDSIEQLAKLQQL